MDLLVIALLFVAFPSGIFCSVDNTVKCLVCRHVVDDIFTAVKNEDPRKKIQVGSFRIEPDGSQKQAEVQYAGSELHLHEILENVCSSLNDYAQAEHKETGELALLNLSKDIEKLSNYELVRDPNLNRGLKYYCESFIEDFEDDIISEFGHSKMKEDRDARDHLCQTVAGYCTLGPQAKRHEL